MMPRVNPPRAAYSFTGDVAIASGVDHLVVV
jgi:hypothetical protein